MKAELCSQSFPIDRERTPGEGAGTEWQYGCRGPSTLYPLDVTQECERMCERPVRGTDRLGLLEMRVARHHRIHPLRRQVVERLTHGSQLPFDAVRGGHAVCSDPRRGLVVSGSSRVEFSGNLTPPLQHTFDDRVDILIRSVRQTAFGDSCLHGL